MGLRGGTKTESDADIWRRTHIEEALAQDSTHHRLLADAWRARSERSASVGGSSIDGDAKEHATLHYVAALLAAQDETNRLLRLLLEKG